ncbi:MAG TPA: c-type cytochrome [Terriglobia bacterium]|nr:c-type cytochrome [Terriglobia bacterium]
MRIVLGILVLVSISALSLATPQLGQLRQPSWAFQVIDPVQPPAAEESGPVRIPGSSMTYTRADIENLSAPPDWFPEENAPKPPIVLRGRGAVLACGACHLMSGLGHPESADLTGLRASYIIQQLVDFKSGARKDMSRMNGIAAAMTDEEMKQSAEWFAARKPAPWNRVVEAGTVPKTYIGPGRMRYPHPDKTTEAIGSRIVTLPEDPARARNRDPKSGFIANVPTGSIARGKALVETGGNGKTIACTICHGDNLKGLADVPRLAGVHSIYIARQLYLFKNGERNGIDAQLMKKPVAQLTDDDIIAISAYLGSLAP